MAAKSKKLAGKSKKPAKAKRPAKAKKAVKAKKPAKRSAKKPTSKKTGGLLTRGGRRGKQGGGGTPFDKILFTDPTAGASVTVTLTTSTDTPGVSGSYTSPPIESGGSYTFHVPDGPTNIVAMSAVVTVTTVGKDGKPTSISGSSFACTNSPTDGYCFTTAVISANGPNGTIIGNLQGADMSGMWK